MVEKNRKRIIGEFWAIPKSIMELKISLEARMIYGILFTMQNGDNESWPSQETIAKELQIGARSVRRYIDELKTNELVEVKRMGLKKTNRYSLTGQVGLSREDTVVRSREDKDVLSSVKEHSKKNNENSASADWTEVNEIIDLFKAVNPSWEQLFKNKTERAAIRRLKDILPGGADQLREVIKWLPRVNAETYSGLMITTPHQLERDFGKLKIFAEKQKNKNKGHVGKVGIAI